MTQITVGTADLRNALLSVAPHAGDDDAPLIHRIRLTVDDHNMWVTATNRYTAAMAIVTTEDWDDNEDRDIDLSPTDVKEILSLFKTSGGTTDDQPDDTLRIEADAEHTGITDVSGLFPGKSLRLPRYPTDDNYPNIPNFIYDQLNLPSSSVERVATSGKLLGLFGAAARVYKEPLIVEPTGETTALVIACGESFLGLLSPIRPEPENQARIDEWREAWMGRLTRRTRILEPA